jgi:hypothetical protein
MSSSSSVGRPSGASDFHVPSEQATHATSSPSRNQPSSARKAQGPLSALERMPRELHQAIGDQAQLRDAHALAQTSTTFRRSLTTHSAAHLVTERAKGASTLNQVEQALGTPPDVDGLGGSGIRGLPRSMQAEPTRELNLRIIHIPREERAQVATRLASHTVETGDPQAFEMLTRTVGLIPGGEDATAAIRTLWSPVNQLPPQHRRLPLYGLTTSIQKFPVSEQPARFREHLSAWEELVKTMPDSLRSTPTSNSPLDTVLPNMVAELPSDFQAEARDRIAAMKTAVYG